MYTARLFSHYDWSEWVKSFCLLVYLFLFLGMPLKIPFFSPVYCSWVLFTALERPHISSILPLALVGKITTIFSHICLVSYPIISSSWSTMCPSLNMVYNAALSSKFETLSEDYETPKKDVALLKDRFQEIKKKLERSDALEAKFDLLKALLSGKKPTMQNWLLNFTSLLR